MHQHQFRLPGAFRMTMWNQLWDVSLIYNKKCLLVHFAWSCEMEIYDFSTLFWHFFHFFLMNPPQPPPNQLQSLVQVHCFFLIIHIVCPSQFHFFLSLNATEITLKNLQNFTKTSSISCKGNNVLIGHIRHNYYSKGMELMRTII